MNEKQSTPSLNRFDASELPVRLLRSPYFIHRTPIRGYYLDPEYNLNLVKSPREKLSLFLAEAKRVAAAGDDMGKVTYTPKENLRPLRYINEGAIKEFEEAAKSFYTSGINAAQASLRENFRLPDPAKEPDAYWVCGDRFAPRLLILWGCEKEQGTALPLVGKARSVVTELRSKAMSWIRLIREGVELGRQDTLAAYIAFPVLTPDGTLTHLDRLVDGKYVREEVHLGHSQSFKARPMKRLAASSVQQYQKLAREFYRKGHPADCACVLCSPLGGAKAAPGATPGTLSYEQELRRGFRLPDPDLRPDAYFVTGRPMTGQLLILCPHPGVKDAEEIEQMAQDVKWAEDKARTPEDRERARLLHEQYDEDLATHNLYKRYFYSENECLPLLPDEVLGLPKAVPRPSAAGAAPVLAPTLAPSPVAEDGADHTIYDRLWKRRFDWQKFILVTSVAAGVILAVGITTWMLWPKQLAVVSAEMSNDPVLDPGNQRNVIEVEFNNRLGEGLISEWKKKTVGQEAAGQPTLHFNGSEIKLLPPKINSTNHHRMVLTIAVPDFSLEEENDGKYTLELEKARDIWGNRMPTNSRPVKVVDKRGPSHVGAVKTAPSESNDSIQLSFDEPLDKSSAESAGNYTLTNNSFKSAQLQPDQKTVVLKADKPFESGVSYVLGLTANITDAARAKNHLHATNANFKYAQIPLELASVSAKDAQNMITVVFNRPIDRASAKSALLVSNLNIGAVLPLDDKSVRIVLTNSYMTNGSYTLQIKRLKDTSGKPENELTAETVFSYEGKTDLSPPVILPREFTATSNRLTIPFSKPLREETAINQNHYTLEYKKGENWQPVGTTFRPEISGAPNTVVLNFSVNLPDGDLRLKCSGVEDLAGNSTNDEKEFVTGLHIPIQTRRAAKIVNAEGTVIEFTLSERIDQLCATPANFKLEGLDGRSVPGLEIRNVTITPHINTSDVHLELSDKLKMDQFQVRFSRIRREGQAWEEDGVATTAVH